MMLRATGIAENKYLMIAVLESAQILRKALILSIPA